MIIIVFIIDSRYLNEFIQKQLENNFSYKLYSKC